MQVRSIGDQLSVLRTLAKDEGLSIAEEFVEKQSAKHPGRPIFGEMMAWIEKGEARGLAQTQWASLLEAHSPRVEAGREVNQKPLCMIMERVRGIEPLSSAWKAEVIPVYDTRVLMHHAPHIL